MARKNTLKSDNPGSIHFDPRTKSVMAETSHLQDNIKEKVNAVREVMPGRSNNEIILVLQFYDYNVEKAIQAYVEDGAKQALKEWHFPGNKAPKKKRNKKKKTANDSSPEVNGHVATAEIVQNGDVTNGLVESDTEPAKTGSDMSSSVSSLSMSPTTSNVPTENCKQVVPPDTSQYTPLEQRPVKSNVKSHSSPSGQKQGGSTAKSQSKPSGGKPAESTAKSPSSSSASARPKSQSPAATGGATSRNKSQSPLSDGKQMQVSNTKPSQTSATKVQTSVTVTNSSMSATSQPNQRQQNSLPVTSQPNQRQQHSHSRQHHNSGSHSHRSRTSSERSTDGHSGPKQIHKTLEKSVKDLHRQTVSLERLRLVLNEEVDKNYKRMKSVFDEMRSCLNDREVELIREMDQVKVVANETFRKRQKSAIDLKQDIDRAERMDDKQIAQLRADIKHFVSERKIDEDLSRTTRFLYDSDYLKREILQFGEVVPVKCSYSLRRPSVSSVVSNEDITAVETSVPVPVSQSEGEVHPHGLDAKATAEVAELHQRLKNSLHIQGYDKSTPRPASQPSKQENMQDQQRPDQRQQGGSRPQTSGGSRPQSGGRGYGYRGRGGGYRGRGQGRPRSPRKDNSQGGRGRATYVNSSP